MFRRILGTFAASMLLCGGTSFAQAPGTAPSAAPKATKSAAKPAEVAKPPAAVAGGAEPTLIGQFGTWGAYSATPNGKLVCFALAKPASSKTNPPNRPRDPAYAFVSTRPAENVHNEVSAIMGYQLKPDSEVNVEIGNNKFVMYTKADGAWISNAAEEARMVETMRKGADIVITGTSARGTQSTDRYSLKGLSQALDRTAKECK